MINFTIFLVLITIVSFLLIVVVMVQNPKGGGLSSAIGGPQVMGGVQKTSDFLDKSTWTLAGILVILILMSSLSFSSGYSGEEPLTDDSSIPAQQTAPAQNGAPANGATTPAPVAQPATPAPAAPAQ
jgi:preprotein translocase subunit SecG